MLHPSTRTRHLTPTAGTVPSARREKSKLGRLVGASIVVFNQMQFKGVCCSDALGGLRAY